MFRRVGRAHTKGTVHRPHPKGIVYLHTLFGVGKLIKSGEGSGFRAFFGDLGTQFGRKRLNVIASSLKTRVGAPEGVFSAETYFLVKRLDNTKGR